MSSVGERIRAKNGFNWRDFDAYMFDIDGTLLNSRGQIHYHSFSAAMREVYGVEGTIDGVVWHGNTDIGILRSALENHGVDRATFESKREQALSVMRREVEKNASRVEADLCPAIATLLQELDREGKLLGVSSGNLEIIGWVKLRAANIAHHFKFGSFSDVNDTRVEIFRHAAKLAGIHGKNNHETKVCFIGDTPTDISAAHQLGLPVIAVATGIHSFDELAAHEPELCLACCEDLYPPS